MIEFTCSQCGKKLKVGDEAAGKRGKCPQCAAMIPVPQGQARVPVVQPSVYSEPALLARRSRRPDWNDQRAQCLPKQRSCFNTPAPQGRRNVAAGEGRRAGRVQVRPAGPRSAKRTRAGSVPGADRVSIRRKRGEG